MDEGAVRPIPARGWLFAGWRGACEDAILCVPVGTQTPDAVFVEAPPDLESKAAAHLLGEPTLTEPVQRALDLLGNRNGRYDTGDFRALERREVREAQ